MKNKKNDNKENSINAADNKKLEDKILTEWAKINQSRQITQTDRLTSLRAFSQRAIEIIQADTISKIKGRIKRTKLEQCVCDKASAGWYIFEDRILDYEALLKEVEK